MGGGAGKKRAPRWAKHQQRQHSPSLVPPTTAAKTMASNLPLISDDASATTTPSTSSRPSDFSLPSCSAVPASPEDAEAARLVAGVLDKAEVRRGSQEMKEGRARRMLDSGVR